MSDAADITDADAFQDLGQNTDFFSELAPGTDQPAIGDLPGAHDHEEVQANQQEAGNAETMPAVIIDYFPSGWAGAPITSMARGTSIYKSCQDTHANSEWAPFTSQGDWLFARWAKTQGLTSSLLDNLLRMPQVRSSLYSPSKLLICGSRW
jgi:hypothetical protein